MTTFAKKTFDVAGYLACRPKVTLPDTKHGIDNRTYPTKVYDTIYAYHTGRYDTALDLGCGPGFIAANLAARFKRVLAIDPSEKMVQSGIQPEDLPSIEYKVGEAEGISGITKDNSLDLVVAGQAAHWFDYPKVWRELTRTVRPGGTVAFVGYAEMVFPQYPQLNSIIAHHSRGQDQLGPYWQPGRKIVESLLDPVPFPISPRPPSILSLASSEFRAASIREPLLSEQPFDCDVWDPTSAVRLKEIDGQQWLMTKKFDYSALEGYLRTWSALHSYQEAHPEDETTGGQDGDIVDRVLAKIKQGLRQAGHHTDPIEVGWPLILMMIRKKS